MNELVELDAVAALEALRTGSIRAEDYAAALLRRAQERSSLNAFRTLDPDRVLESARAADRDRAAGKRLGRMHGLPIPVKDSVNTRDWPTSNGTKALEHFLPKEDASVLRPLLAAGAFIMGKTNIHELSRSYSCNNGAFGPILNAYDPTRIPGGSSGGSATAVAARMAPLAIAEDTLGSIRIPATLSGVVGFRPTFGRYPGDGIMPLTLDRFDQVGPLSRSVADIVLFDDVLTGDATRVTARRLADVRIGISEFLLSALDPEVERIALQAMEKLAQAGAALVRVEMPDIAREALAIARAIIGFENSRSIAAFLRSQGIALTFEELLAQASPNVREIYTVEFTADAHEKALRDRETLSAALRQYYADNRLDALLFPPSLAPAPALGDGPVTIGGESVPLRQVMARNTSLSSVARLASLTLPAGLTRAGLPVGMEMVALPGEDRALLALGLAAEEAWGRIPAPPATQAG